MGAEAMDALCQAKSCRGREFFGSKSEWLLMPGCQQFTPLNIEITCSAFARHFAISRAQTAKPDAL
jgi:hypothetical protein